MTVLLIVAYASMMGDVSIKSYPRPSYAQCQQEATKIYNKVHAGSVRAWCYKLEGVANAQIAN